MVDPLGGAAWVLADVRVWDGVSTSGFADALAFDPDGRVQAIGTKAAVLAAVPRGTEIVSGGGSTVVPGFVDAHTHVRAAASATLAWPCDDVRTTAELLALVKRAVRAAAPGAWVTLAGLESRALVDGVPHREALDRVTAGHPVRIRDRSLHAWLLNSAAANRVGPAAETDPGTSLVIDDHGAIRAAMGRVSDEPAFESAVRSWSAARLRDGVTALLDVTATNTVSDVETLRSWCERGVIMQHAAALVGERHHEAAADQEGVPVPGVKLMFAGERRSVADARRRILSAWRTRPLAAVHCADVEALADVIGAVEGIPRDDRRALRIEHGSMCPPEWLDRVAAIGATVVTQPAFVWAHGDRYLATVQPALQPWMHRLRSWIEHGVRVAAGSDEPAGAGAPLVGWRAAVERRTAQGRLLGDRERLTRGAAMATITSAAANACHANDIGRLLPGHRGCAVVLSGDPLGDGRLEDVAVEMTVLDGRRVVA